MTKAFALFCQDVHNGYNLKDKVGEEYSVLVSRLKTGKRLISVIVILVLTILPTIAHAATDSDNTTINAILGSTISVSSSGTVNLNVTPISGGSQTSASDTVSVSTNHSAGYTLTLADSDGTTTLTKGGDTIAAHTGTQASPSVLANNSWGYRVDSIGGFSTGGAVENNVASSSITYAGVPASGAPNTIKTTATTASGDTTTVWYAVKADTSKPNGTYSDTVTYTATTN